MAVVVHIVAVEHVVVVVCLCACVCGGGDPNIQF